MNSRVIKRYNCWWLRLAVGKLWDRVTVAWKGNRPSVGYNDKLINPSHPPPPQSRVIDVVGYTAHLHLQTALNSPLLRQSPRVRMTEIHVSGDVDGI